MKNLLFLSLFLLGLTACNQDAGDEPAELTDDQLIENLAVSVEAREADPEQLPPMIVEDIALNYYETFLELAEEIPSEGYIAYLADGNILYYDWNGRNLEYRGDPANSMVFQGRHPHGRCFRRLVRFGRHLPPAELTDAISSYITENYPDETVRAAKALGDTTLVLISGPAVLAFDANDAFIGERNPLEHCTDRCRPISEMMRDRIEEYVENNFENVEVLRICVRHHRIFVLAQRGENRAIMIFSLQGQFLGIRR